MMEIFTPPQEPKIDVIWTADLYKCGRDIYREAEKYGDVNTLPITELHKDWLTK